MFIDYLFVKYSSKQSEISLRVKQIQDHKVFSGTTNEFFARCYINKKLKAKEKAPMLKLNLQVATINQTNIGDCSNHPSHSGPR